LKIPKSGVKDGVYITQRACRAGGSIKPRVSDRSERNPGIKPRKKPRAREAGDRNSLFPSTASQAQLNSLVRFSTRGCVSPGAAGGCAASLLGTTQVY